MSVMRPLAVSNGGPRRPRPERPALAAGGAKPGIDRSSLHQEENMNLKQTATVLSFASMLGMAELCAPGFIDGIAMASSRVTKIANKDG